MATPCLTADAGTARCMRSRRRRARR